MSHDTLSKVTLFLLILVTLFILVPAAREYIADRNERQSIRSTLTKNQLAACKNTTFKKGCFRLLIEDAQRHAKYRACKFYTYVCSW